MKRILILAGTVLAALLATPAIAGATYIPGPAPVPNVVYGTSDPSSQVMDIYPAATPGAPIVILVHGGGWVRIDKRSLDSESMDLNAQGFAVFNLNYRLAATPGSAFPNQVNDVELATQWAMANAAAYNADPTDVTLIGGSAGGQLVGMAAEQLNAARKGTVQAVVTLSAATDFGGMVNDLAVGHINPVIVNMSSFALGCNLTVCPSATLAQWSPAQNVTASNCPANWLVIQSAHDAIMPADQPIAMTSALQQHGCAVTQDIIAGNDHSFNYWSVVEPAVSGFVASQP